MCTIYAKQSCLHARKVIRYLERNHIKHSLKRVGKHDIRPDDIKQLLHYSVYGFKEILTYNGFKKITPDMSMREAINLICNNPIMLKSPILLHKNILIVGASKDALNILEKVGAKYDN